VTDERAIVLLEAMRNVGRIGARLGIQAEIQFAPSETLELLRALLASPPSITWDGDRLEGALLLEVGERAAHALRLARRRVRRKARGCKMVAGKATKGPGRRRA